VFETKWRLFFGDFGNDPFEHGNFPDFGIFIISCFGLTVVGQNLVLSILVDNWSLQNTLDEPLFWR
jgi:hypothetical protein